VAPTVRYQPSLFDDATEPAFDATFSALQRVWLDDSAWIDLVPGWLSGADPLFEQIVRARAWGQRSRWMYDHRVDEPRMTSHWTLASGEALEPSVLDEIRRALSARYAVTFDSAGFNWYRDGRDSVAWHRDRIRREIPNPVVPLLSLGEPRKLMFRPRGGGPSSSLRGRAATRAFPVGHGDLLVTGGTTQRTWEHAVLKVAHAGPRVSVAFRYGLDSRAYGRDDER
jgi:alkylated DNA repair dioxygenase AlkB